MPKGYWIARVDVTEDEAYKRYVTLNQAAFAKYGGRYLVRGGAHEAVEGQARSRNVVIEFPTYAAARECYRSPEYAAAHEAREGAAEIELLIIEGYEGVQPVE